MNVHECAQTLRSSFGLPSLPLTPPLFLGAACAGARAPCAPAVSRTGVCRNRARARVAALEACRARAIAAACGVVAERGGVRALCCGAQGSWWRLIAPG